MFFPQVYENNDQYVLNDSNSGTMIILLNLTHPTILKDLYELHVSFFITYH